jgi:hypothetical protein
MGYDIYSRKVLTKKSDFGDVGEKAYFRASIGVAFLPRLVSDMLGVQGIIDVWTNGVSGDGEHHFGADDCHEAMTKIETEEKRNAFVESVLDRLYGRGDYLFNGLIDESEWIGGALRSNSIDDVRSYIESYLDYIKEIADLDGAEAW